MASASAPTLSLVFGFRIKILCCKTSGFLKSNSMVPTLAVISALVNFMVPGGLPTADSSSFCTDFLSSEKTDVVINVTINEMLIIFQFLFPELN